MPHDIIGDRNLTHSYRRYQRGYSDPVHHSDEQYTAASYPLALEALPAVYRVSLLATRGQGKNRVPCLSYSSETETHAVSYNGTVHKILTKILLSPDAAGLSSTHPCRSHFRAHEGRYRGCTEFHYFQSGTRGRPGLATALKSPREFSYA